MARRLIFKDDYLSQSSNPDSGFKIIGYDGLVFSERLPNGQIVPIGGSGGGGLIGTGTTNYTPRWTNSNTLSSTSSIYDDGQNVGIGTNVLTYKVNISGGIGTNGSGNVGRITLTDTQSGGATIVLNPQITYAVPGLETTGSFPIAFATNTEERMRISETGNIGIGTQSPAYQFQIFSPTASFHLKHLSSGSYFELLGTKKITQIATSTIASGTYSSASLSIGVRAWDDTTTAGYGKVGDTFLYSSADSNGLNILSQDGASSEDYIRFYAGRDASQSPDVHIQGTGTTRGFVGIGILNPQYKLEVSGTVSSTGLNVTSRARLDGAILTTSMTSTTGATTPTITDVSVWRIKFSATPSVGVTLPDGVNGQRLAVYVYDDSLGGSVIVTPTTAANFTSFSLTIMGQGLDLIFDSTIGWVIIGTRGINTDNIAKINVS